MPRRKKLPLEWTRAAAVHLEEIRAYIARNAPTNARRFIAKIRRGVEGLRTFPNIGELLEADERGHLRELYFQSYRVIFRVLPDRVRILAIVHAARANPFLAE